MSRIYFEEPTDDDPPYAGYVIYSQHCRFRCRKDINADKTELASPGSHDTRRVVDIAVRLVIEDGLP